ncbi:methionine aminopeptidase [Lepeophtheirus salmonis]|uniref:methionine aminopeptidase n=1 Tax=Lepeophtheirus salmonis TaxID=72036 RepID=UPI001AE731AC|nr:methionine aminopeptidase-like [Lepeophtheirus salmonis]
MLLMSKMGMRHLIRKRLFSLFDTPKYSIVIPHPTSPQISYNSIPEGITLPPYALNGVPPSSPSNLVEIKNVSRINSMREAGKIAKSLLISVEELIKPGITTDEIDKKINDLCFHKYEVYPSPLNYKGFPKSVCTSVNNVACHGIPDSRPLEEGDIINVDITIFTKDKVHADCSRTFSVGEIDEKAKSLLSVAEEALWVGIKEVAPNKPINSIGKSIENFVQLKGYCVIPIFTGHGIGSNFHECPDIFHFTYDGDDLCMAPGMTFTIEPIVGEKSDAIRILQQDGWTALSVDNSRSAQFEHTVLVTDSGFEVLT